MAPIPLLGEGKAHLIALSRSLHGHSDRYRIWNEIGSFLWPEYDVTHRVLGYFQDLVLVRRLGRPTTEDHSPWGEKEAVRAPPLPGGK